MTPPNILLLYCDQFNARCLSFAGHPDVQTPNLDRLAGQSVAFENAYVQNPVCTPSRVCTLSGTYASTHGYYGLYGPEPAARLTNLFAYFAEHGYRTGALGKLHTPKYWVERACQTVYDEFDQFPTYLDAVGLYERNDNRPFAGKRDGQPSLLPLEHACETVLAKQALHFIRNEGEPLNRGDAANPWLAWVSFSRPHSPLTPSEPYASMYPANEITLPPSAAPEVWANQPYRKRQVPGQKMPPTPEQSRRMLSAYLGLVSQIDAAIGNILDNLTEQGLMDNTVIVFTADHGDYAGEYGLWSKYGGISSRAITRVPLLIRLPNSVSSRTSEAMVESIDLFPTLADLAGLPAPDHTQGLSLAPLMRNEVNAIRESALTENAYRKALATPTWRYVANLGEQPDELYNMVEDPWETTNRIDDANCEKIAQDLLRQLFARVATARRPVTLMPQSGNIWRHDYDQDGHAPNPPSYGEWQNAQL